LAKYSGLNRRSPLGKGPTFITAGVSLAGKKIKKIQKTLAQSKNLSIFVTINKAQRANKTMQFVHTYHFLLSGAAFAAAGERVVYPISQLILSELANSQAADFFALAATFSRPSPFFLQKSTNIWAPSPGEIRTASNDFPFAGTNFSPAESRIALAQNRIALAQNEIARAQNRIARAQNEIAHAQNRIAHTQNEIAHTQNEIAHAQNRIAPAQNFQTQASTILYFIE
jgi:hypothetical protein